jgi:hypothetical protein
VKRLFSRCGFAAVAFAAFLGAGSVLSAPMPEEIEKQLSEHLPAAFVPVPASGATKIFPLVSEKRKSPDRKYAITVDGTPFAITAIGDGGKIVEMMVPAGLHTEEFTKRWFKAEDVFGKIKWKLTPYTPEVPCLAYLNGGKGPLELVAKISSGTPCAVLGTVVADKAPQKLVQVRRALQGGGQENSFMLVFIRENPPVKTQAEYDARAKQMMAEHAFRTGRPWGKMFPSVLGNNGCFECAAMAADASTYMFDGGLSTGERFEKVDDIRSGDVVHFKTHYIFVIYRKGSQLTTIEGNMNEAVCQSVKRYAVSDGKFFVSGQEKEFTHGFHNWPPPK